MASVVRANFDGRKYEFAPYDGESGMKYTHGFRQDFMDFARGKMADDDWTMYDVLIDENDDGGVNGLQIPPAANAAHNSTACPRVQRRRSKIMKVCKEAPRMPPQSLRCLRRHCDCSQPARRRRLVERRLLPTKGHRLRPVASLLYGELSVV